jgi:uncharacterized membrane protein (DUF2068 family)
MNGVPAIGRALTKGDMAGDAGDPNDPSRPPRVRGPVSLRAIAVLKLGQSLVLAMLALGTLHLLRPEVSADVQEWIGNLPVDSQHDLIWRGLTWLLDVPRGHAEAVAFGTLLYAMLFGVEGIGLWRGKRWAEWLTVFATTSFVPLEVWEMAHRPGTFKAFLIALNLAVVWLLIRHLRQAPAS